MPTRLARRPGDVGFPELPGASEPAAADAGSSRLAGPRQASPGTVRGEFAERGRKDWSVWSENSEPNPL